MKTWYSTCHIYNNTQKLLKSLPCKLILVKFLSKLKSTRSQMMPFLYVLNWKFSYDVMLLMCQSRQQDFAEFQFVRFLDQGYARIHFCVQYFISIKRFFSGVHVCVNGADTITNWRNVKFMSALTPFTHAWTPEKNRLMLIIL